MRLLCLSCVLGKFLEETSTVVLLEDYDEKRSSGRIKSTSMNILKLIASGEIFQVDLTGGTM